jgi:dipeptide/tripeptide permease
MADATKQPFPRTFYYANAIELLERLAHYGVYIGLALYLSNVVNMSDVQVGWVLGNFRFLGSMAPIPCGSIADRIGFKRSLIIAFIGYAVGYTCLLLFPAKLPAILSLAVIAVSGGFLKPVITGTVVRTSPPGREAEGFGIFYRMVNSGSVVGKTLAYLVRSFVARCSRTRSRRMRRASRRRSLRASAWCCAATERRCGTCASRRSSWCSPASTSCPSSSTSRSRST